ncbi:MAG TPA: hypothetical protein VM686_34220 [Polyangiaceae bacterium]|nr:hypothetical protein [Polyangiaceae bacterium]
MQHGGPPQGYQPYPPQQAYHPQGYPPPTAAVPRPPEWLGWVARGFLGFGLLLAVVTVIAGMSSESLGEAFALATPGPLGFGLVATLLTRKSSTGGAGKPIGLGCLTAFMLTVMVAVFFTVVFPML